MKISRTPLTGRRGLRAKRFDNDQRDAFALSLLGLVTILITAIATQATIPLTRTTYPVSTSVPGGFARFWHDFEQSMICESDPASSACNFVHP